MAIPSFEEFLREKMRIASPDQAAAIAVMLTPTPVSQPQPSAAPPPDDPNAPYNAFLASRVIAPGAGPVQTPAVIPGTPSSPGVTTTSLPNPRITPPSGPFMPAVSGGPSTSLAAPYTSTRYGDTLTSMNSRATTSPVYPPEIAAAMPSNLSGMAEEIQGMPSGFGSDVAGEIVNKGLSGVETFLGRAMSVYDKGRQAVQGRQSQEFYDYLMWTDMTKGRAIATRQVPADITDEEFDAYKQRKLSEFTTGAMTVPKLDVNGQPIQSSDFKFYERLSPAEKEKFKNDYLDAYENGYRPTKQVIAATGQTETVPTGEYFPPGATAGHEFLASKESWYERLINDTIDDPGNVALPFMGGIGGALIKGGESLTAREAAIAAARGVGEATARDAVGSTMVKAAGETLKVFGNTLRAPNLVLNAIPDTVIAGYAGAAKEAFTEIPFIGRLLNPYKRTEAVRFGNDLLDAAMENKSIATGSSFDTGGAPTTNIGGIPEPIPGGELALPSPADFTTTADGVTTPYGGPVMHETVTPTISSEVNPPVYPDYDTRWLNPDYEAKGSSIKASPTVSQVVTYEVGPVEPDAARSFYAEWQPTVEKHLNEMDAIDAAKYEQDPFFRLPKGPEDAKEIIKARVRQAGGYETLPKLMEEQRFMAKTAEVWKKTIPEDFGPMPYDPRYGDEVLPSVKQIDRTVKTSVVTDYSTGRPIRHLQLESGPDKGKILPAVENLSNLVEQAVHGSADDATAARWYLRRLEYGEQASELKAIREKIYGFESVQPETATSKSRRLTEIRNRDGGHWAPVKDGYSQSATLSKNAVPAEAIVRPNESGGLDVWIPQGQRTPRYATAAKDMPTAYFQSGPGIAGPDLTGEGRTLPIRKFQPDPNPIASTKTQEVLREKFTAGEFEGMSAQQVLDVNIAQAKRDLALYWRLLEDGYSPDNLSLSEQRRIKPDVKYGEPGRIKVTTAKETPLFGGTVPAETVSRATLPEPIEKNGDKIMASLEIKWGRYGDLETGDAYTMAAHKSAWDKSLSVDPGLGRQLPLALDLLHALIYRLPRHLLLADPLTSWTYTMRNMMSNELMSAIDSPGIYLDGNRWGSMKGAFKDTDGSVDEEMVNVLTGGRAPKEFRAAAGKLDEAIVRGTTPTYRLMKKLHISGISKPFEWKRGIDRSIERSMKIGGYFSPMLKMQVSEQIPVLTERMVRYAASRGINVTEQELKDLLWSLRDGNGMFGRDEVYNAFYYQGKEIAGLDEVATRKYAETASRSWFELGKDALEETTRRTNRVFPSYLNQTNLDHYLSYVTLFHLWPTRAAKFMLEEMIRHPQLAVAWWRSHEGMRRYAEENGYPDSVKGLLYLGSSPFGFALWANPSALYMVTALLPQQQDLPDRQGATWVGRQLTEIKKSTGLSAVPFVDAILNLTGVYGDASMPDVIPSRTADLVLAALDVALTHTGNPPHSPAWDQTMVNARELLSAMMPWSSGVPADNMSGYAYDLVGSMVLQMNPDLAARMTAKGPDGRPTEDAAAAQREYNAIMDNEQDPRYVAAEQAVSDQGLYTKAINMVFPLSVRAKEMPREETIQLAREGRLLATEDRTPGQQAAIDTRSMVTASPEAGKVESQRATEKAYGTDRQVALDAGWAAIAYYEPSDKQGHILVNGTLYTPSELMAMGEDGRKQLADEWLASQNGIDELATYKDGKYALRDTMPEYAGYTTWSTAMRDAPGGVSYARSYLMKISPGYKNYINGLPETTKSDPAKYDAASLSIDAYLASQGIAGSAYATSPGAALDPTALDPTQYLPWAQSGGTGSSSGSSGGYETATQRLEKLTKAVGTYKSEMAVFDAKVKVITGGTSYDDLAPLWQESLDRRLQREGIKKPSKPGIVSSYEEWRDTINGGNEDYVKYIEFVMQAEKVAA